MEEIDREATKNEINYRGIRAMPFVIGFFYIYTLNLY